MTKALKQNRRLQVGIAVSILTILSGIWAIWHPFLSWDRYGARIIIGIIIGLGFVWDARKQSSGDPGRW